jgi:hypothetical protein
VGLEGKRIEDVQDASKAEGSDMHNAVENHIKHGTPILNDEMRAGYERFFAGAEILECEKSVQGEHWRGRFDLKYRRNGKTYIADFKRECTGIYLNHKIQLVAYSELEPVDGLGIISLPDFKFFPVEIPDREPYVKMLHALSVIHWQMVQVDPWYTRRKAD